MESDRSDLVGLVAAVLAVAGALAIGLAHRPPSPQREDQLQAPPANWPRGDIPLQLIELPDSGGYLYNTDPFDPRTLAQRLRDIVASRPEFPRGVYVRVGSHRSEADLQPVLAAAQQAGWRTFDADKSGIPIFHRVPPESLVR